MTSTSYIAFQPGNKLQDTFLLILICIAGFSCYFTYDIPATVDVDINVNLDTTVEKFMMYFYTAYSLPSAVTAMMSGYIINILGMGNGGIILALILTFAHILIGYSMYSKMALLACFGRVLHGSASEPFGVVRSAFTAKYFNSALFYGLILAFSRAGSVGGIKFTPIVLCFFKSDSPSCIVSVLEEEANSDELLVIENEDEQGNSSYFESEMTTDSTTMTTLLESDRDSNQIFDLKTSLAICFLVGAVVSFLAVIIMWVIKMVDQKIDRQRGFKNDNSEKNGKKLSLKDMGKIPVNAWTLIYIFTIWYSAMFPFNSMLPGYIKNKCKFNKDIAANLASIVYAFSVIGSPAFGFIIDRTKHHSIWLFLSSALLTSTFTFWGYITNLGGIQDQDMILIMTIMMCVLGVAYSIIASSLMAYLADVTPLYLHSTAFGLLFGVQQLGVGSASWIAGKFVNLYGYGKLPYFLSAIGILASIGNVFLLFRDGINPLGNKNRKNKNNVENFVDVTVSRHSYLGGAGTCDDGDRCVELKEINCGNDEDSPFVH